MSTIRVVNLQHTDATEPNIVLLQDGTSVFASGITISGGTNLTVSGTAEFASGTVSAPSVTFIDDNNTGLYSPATDTVAITTAATEQMRIDNSGNVGIGITAPPLKLSVNGDIGLYAGTTEFGRVFNDTGVFHMRGAANMELALGTEAQERLRIDNSGKVGIGTTAPSAQIEIEGNVSSTTQFSGFQGLRIQNANGSSYGVTADINFVAGTSSNNRGAVIGAQFESGTNGNALYFATNGSSVSSNDTPTERMRIDSSGHVAIGTTTFNRTFQVGKNGAETFEFEPGESANNNLSLHFNRSTNLYITNEVRAVDHRFLIQSTEKMRIDSSGRLLVGTSSAPAGTDAQYTKFAIRGNTINSNAAYLSIGNDKSTASTTSSDNLGIITFNDNDSDAGEYARITGAADGTNGTNDYPGKLVFATTADGGSAPTARMHIDSGGDIRSPKTFVVSDNPVSQFYAGNGGVGIFNKDAYSSCGEHIEVGTDSTKGWASVYLNRFGWNSSHDNRMFQFNVNQNAVGYIRSTLSATSYLTTSDYRLKENVVSMSDATSRVKKLSPLRFNFIIDPDTTVDGFLAHEAQAVVPEAVSGTKDEVDADGNAVMQGIDQAKLVPLLTGALQEAIAKIETLEQRLSDAGIA